MISRICFGLLAFVAYEGDELVVASHGRVYVLYPGLRSWNEVQELCSSAGFGMLKLKSGRDSAEFMSYIKKWNNGGALDYDIWMGLYDKLQREKKVVKYQWNDCTGFGSYRPWAGNEPDQKDSEHCVRISTSGVFRTMTCSEHYHTVCQQDVRCWFSEKRVDILKYKAAAHRSATRSKCKQACLNQHEENIMCVAYKHSGGLCTIYLKSPPGSFSGTAPVKRKVALKQCYRGYINSTFPPVSENKDNFADDPCDPDTTSSSSTTTVSPSMVSTTETSSPSSDTTTVTSPGASSSTATTRTTSTVTPTTRKFQPKFVDMTTAGTAAAAPALTVQTTTSSTPAASTFVATVITTTTTAGATTNAAVDSTIQTMTTSVAASTVASATPAMPTTSPTTTSPAEEREGSSQEVCIRVEGLYTLDVMAMLKHLLLEKNILSSYRRSKISIPDNRPSAVSIGMVGICILVGFVVSVVFMDAVKYAS